MHDYSTAAQAFDLDQALASVLSGRADALNACIECCDRYADSGRVALYWEGRDGASATWTFAQLQQASARFANFLHSRGVRPGDCVAGMLPRTPELLITILGTWRLGAVYQPLFTAFGPKAIEHRVSSAGTRLVVVDAANRAKLDEVVDAPPLLTLNAAAGEADFWAELEGQSDRFEPVLRSASDAFLMMFTSGTTGLAKPVPVPLKAIAAFVGYLRDAVDLREDEAFWNLADPGWAYGIYFGITGPLSMGHPITFYDGPFTVESTCRVIKKLGITNLTGSPTAYRMLIAAGDAFSSKIKGQLRVVSSAGEPLNPEVIRWFADELGVTIHDHYGQTEVGMVLCNHHGLDHPVHMGAAGFASPGHRIVVLDGGRLLCTGSPEAVQADPRVITAYLGTATWGRTGNA